MRKPDLFPKKPDQALEAAGKHFPGAKSSEEVLDLVSKVLQQKAYTPENTLYAQSVCPDEINHEEGDITNIFAEYLGEVFHLGGLAGIPFTGSTGFGAFSHHVPEDGHCFVLMAPHIGIDGKGNLGQYDRFGQVSAGAACGAAIGALCHCRDKQSLPDLAAADTDYQMSYIIHKVHESAEVDGFTSKTTDDENGVQARLARRMHTVASSMLEKIVNTSFGGDSSTLVILTGIQINMPEPHTDYFQPLSFYVLDKKMNKEDWFQSTFGANPAKVVPTSDEHGDWA